MPLPLLEGGKGKRSPGAYILVFSLPKPSTIEVGKLGTFHFPAGWYAYVGSARGGLETRVGRHLKEAVRKHWHIDHVLELAAGKKAYLFPSDEDIECLLAMELSSVKGITRPVKGFGSSDCRCPSHLFFIEYAEKNAVGRLANSRGAAILR